MYFIDGDTRDDFEYKDIRYASAMLPHWKCHAGDFSGKAIEFREFQSRHMEYYDNCLDEGFMIYYNGELEISDS